MGKCIIGSARHNENGTYATGIPGDQTGTEVSTQEYYTHKKGWRILRPISILDAKNIADDMYVACENPMVGYSQNDNQSLYKNVKSLNYNILLLKTPSNTDCARLVRVCVLYAGIPVEDFYTGDMADKLLKTKRFIEVTNKIALPSGLKRGDILVTKTKGHTVVCLTNGDGSTPDYSQLNSSTSSTENKADTANKNESLNKENSTSNNVSNQISKFPYKVKILTNLNVRKGPGTAYPIVTIVKTNEVYTIIAENGKWGKLKSGAGWISLNYTKKL